MTTWANTCLRYPAVLMVLPDLQKETDGEYSPRYQQGGEFLKKTFKPVSDWWSSLKLRASVGSLGNQQVDYYAYLQTITSDNQFSYTFDGEGKAYYAKISNPISSGLTWETVTTYNVGLDMSFLRNRLSMSADYYVRKTTDMLTTSLTLPDVYGASTPKANCADLRTNGWELSVSWNDSFKVANKPFRYGIQATLGDYQRTITKYNNRTN